MQRVSGMGGGRASGGAALSAALSQVQAQRSARKLPHLRVVVDPARLG